MLPMKDGISDPAITVKDPVCGMNVNPGTAKHRVDHAGKSQYFCCASCAEKFKSDPGKYLNPARPDAKLITLTASSARPRPAEYTCPMHPEIIRPKPGSCPICGMALEPRTISAIEEENPELRDMTRRFWISLALT